MNCCQKGRSMIEMLGVLAIVGVLSVGGIAGYSKAMTKLRGNRLIAQITELVMNIRSTYFQQQSIENINNKLLVDVGIVPGELIERDGSTVTLWHAFAGQIVILPSKSEAGKWQAFEIYIHHLSGPVCQSLVVMDWGQDPSSGFQGLYIGTDDGEISDPKLIDVNGGASDPSAGIYTPGLHEHSIPLGIEESMQVCTCPDSNCTIGLKYLL